MADMVEERKIYTLVPVGEGTDDPDGQPDAGEASEKDPEIIPLTNEWTERQREKAERVEAIRNRIQSAGSRYEENREYFRPAKPKPTIHDDSNKVVAVYARVSTSSENQTSSIENQTLYYTQKIAETPNWEMQEIYSDEGKSGTSIERRPEFQRMIQEAGQKKFDMIICASVSRFARNVSECLDQIQKLKNINPSHPIGVYFETENIYTLDSDSDAALGIHALLADWESKNKSSRMILSYDQRIATGQYPVSDLLGYRHTKDGGLIVQQDEAETVRYIYLAYLAGNSCEEIAAVLTEKKRPTMHGRTDWNGGMVRSVMQNERRWGDLEARKTIVFDYKQRIVIKNNNDRCSAYVPQHHVGIVSPEIAAAARFVASSSRNLGGLPELGLIDRGTLKGFVSVNPAWSGMDAKTYREICEAAYSGDELEDIYMRNHLRDGTGHSKAVSMQMAGFHVPYGVLLLNRSMPAMTISRKSIRFNKVCHQRLKGCRHIEMFYHPLLKVVAIRAGEASGPYAFAWEKEDGSIIANIPSRGFSDAVYEAMDWLDDLQFRFRGIMKECGDTRIIFFFLDEPKILPDKKKKEELRQAAAGDTDIESRFIPYRKSDVADDAPGQGGYGYPEEWRGHMGMADPQRRTRDRGLCSITEKDAAEKGIYVENPMIGILPSKAEIAEELEELLMSM